jgi:hypothetical protein
MAQRCNVLCCGATYNTAMQRAGLRCNVFQAAIGASKPSAVLPCVGRCSGMRSRGRGEARRGEARRGEARRGEQLGCARGGAAGAHRLSVPHVATQHNMLQRSKPWLQRSASCALSWRTNPEGRPTRIGLPCSMMPFMFMAICAISDVRNSTKAYRPSVADRSCPVPVQMWPGQRSVCRGGMYQAHCD